MRRSREGVRRDASRSAAGTPDGTDKVRTAANDNALARIARDIRRTAFGWRHARTVAAFADGRREVLAAWDALRERTRVDGDTVALGREFGETLARHAALLKQAGTFRARPDEYAALLAERGGIGRRDLDAFEQLHARARRHRRAATMRQVHRARREADWTPGTDAGTDDRTGARAGAAAGHARAGGRRRSLRFRGPEAGEPPQTPEERAPKPNGTPSGTPSNSPGFSRPRTTQPGKSARRRRRPSTRSGHGWPTSTARPGKRRARPAGSRRAGEWACSGYGQSTVVRRGGSTPIGARTH